MNEEPNGCMPLHGGIIEALKSRKQPLNRAPLEANILCHYRKLSSCLPVSKPDSSMMIVLLKVAAL